MANNGLTGVQRSRARKRCLLCDRATYSRHAKYCRDHKGGHNVPKYPMAAALVHFVKSACFTPTEAETFRTHCQYHKLSVQSFAHQNLLVHLGILQIMIRREAVRLHRAVTKDITPMFKLIQLHTSISDKLGLCGAAKKSAEIPFGIDEFLEGADEAD